MNYARVENNSVAEYPYTIAALKKANPNSSFPANPLGHPNVQIDQANEPMCYIHKDCKNLIESLINYNSKGKSDEALKDFFDLIRYFRMANAGEGPDHIDSRELTTTTNTKGGY